MSDTVSKWDKPRDLIEDMLKAARELEQAWPHIDNRDLRQYWHREIDRTTKSLQMLRQAAEAGQEMDRIEQQRDEVAR